MPILAKGVSYLDEQQSKSNCFPAIDIIKYIAAIMIICIHCKVVIQIPAYNFVLKNIICRIAVPFFFIATGFFVRKGTLKSANYLRCYLRSLLKSYLIWSLIFLPIGLDWIQQHMNLPVYLYPVALFAGLIYTGTFYHLWYIPATVFALLVMNWLLKKMNYTKIMLLAALLYGFGCLESYSSMLVGTIFGSVFSMYQQVLITTRNGLFFGLIFVAIGYFIYDHAEKLVVLQKYLGRMTLLFGGLQLAEGLLLLSNRGSDTNFTLSLVPLSFCLFLWAMSLQWQPKLNLGKLRAYSKYYYFIHPLFLTLFIKIANAFFADSFLNAGWFQFMITLVLTHLFSCFLIYGQKRYRILIQRQAVKTVARSFFSKVKISYTYRLMKKVKGFSLSLLRLGPNLSE